MDGVVEASFFGNSGAAGYIFHSCWGTHSGLGFVLRSYTERIAGWHSGSCNTGTVSVGKQLVDVHGGWDCSTKSDLESFDGAGEPDRTGTVTTFLVCIACRCPLSV